MVWVTCYNDSKGALAELDVEVARVSAVHDSGAVVVQDVPTKIHVHQYSGVCWPGFRCTGRDVHVVIVICFNDSKGALAELDVEVARVSAVHDNGALVVQDVPTKIHVHQYSGVCWPGFRCTGRDVRVVICFNDSKGALAELGVDVAGVSAVHDRGEYVAIKIHVHQYSGGCWPGFRCTGRYVHVVIVICLNYSKGALAELDVEFARVSAVHDSGAMVVQDVPTKIHVHQYSGVRWPGFRCTGREVRVVMVTCFNDSKGALAELDVEVARVSAIHDSGAMVVQDVPTKIHVHQYSGVCWP
ncbi:hypothetical protein NDU88_001131 [Pleurodeles waltl]|uniref:Uncharacterized protein n=1 Tax=Pleurodeles waltl TaxID=8319 RepID=A0AAV7KVD6_PLEWA|nr:hypothetical protein NDU88_001131 [Pleurodeles waltl]